MNTRDETYLLDMVDAAREAIGFCQDVTFDEFVENRQKQLAVQKLVQNIGEAAVHISKSITDAHADVAWSRIIGMRNIVVHNYSDVDLTIVWNVITHNLPELIAQIEHVLSSDSDTSL
jgi:uncharacterized protein with HEPN domain